MDEAQRLKEQCKTVEQDDGAEFVSAYDDVSGAPLDPAKVYEAKKEEVKFIRDMKLYHEVPIKECWERIGKIPITTKWIDINKGDNVNPKYRSRNVAREIARSKQDGLFAATPPLEVMKLLLSTLASGNKGERLMVADVKRAYFHAKSTRDVKIELPEADYEEGVCRKLEKSVYRTRDAAQNWEAACT